MDKDLRKKLYGFILGISLAFFVFTWSYRQPESEFDLTNFNFRLVTEDMQDLGWAFSTIGLRYRPGGVLGRLYVIIGTDVSEPIWRSSIFPRDIGYNISVSWGSKLLEQIDGSYLGALHPDRGRTMYMVFTLPSGKHPMDALRKSVYGGVTISVRGVFYNITSKEICADKTKDLSIFIMPASSKLVSSSLFTIVSIAGVVGKSIPDVEERFRAFLRTR